MFLFWPRVSEISNQDVKIFLYPGYSTAFRGALALSMQDINSCLVLL